MKRLLILLILLCALPAPAVTTHHDRVVAAADLAYSEGDKEYSGACWDEVNQKWYVVSDSNAVGLGAITALYPDGTHLATQMISGDIESCAVIPGDDQYLFVTVENNGIVKAYNIHAWRDGVDAIPGNADDWTDNLTRLNTDPNHRTDLLSLQWNLLLPISDSGSQGTEAMSFIPFGDEDIICDSATDCIGNGAFVFGKQAGVGQDVNNAKLAAVALDPQGTAFTEYIIPYQGDWGAGGLPGPTVGDDTLLDEPCPNYTQLQVRGLDYDSATDTLYWATTGTNQDLVCVATPPKCDIGGRAGLTCFDDAHCPGSGDCVPAVFVAEADLPGTAPLNEGIAVCPDCGYIIRTEENGAGTTGRIYRWDDAYAITRHVATGGDDAYSWAGPYANNCTADDSEPCATVQQCIDSMNPGDTCTVANGTYSTLEDGGSTFMDFDLANNSGLDCSTDQCVVTATNVNASAPNVVFENLDPLHGLQFTNVNNIDVIGFEFNAEEVMDVSGSDNITVSSSLHKWSSDPVDSDPALAFIHGGSDFFTWQDSTVIQDVPTCDFVNNANPKNFTIDGGDGHLLQRNFFRSPTLGDVDNGASNVTIKRNIFEHVSEHGLTMNDDDGTDPGPIIIENNIFQGDPTCAAFCDPVAPPGTSSPSTCAVGGNRLLDIYDVNGLTFRNNTIAGHGYGFQSLVHTYKDECAATPCTRANIGIYNNAIVDLADWSNTYYFWIDGGTGAGAVHSGNYSTRANYYEDNESGLPGRWGDFRPTDNGAGNGCGAGGDGSASTTWTDWQACDAWGFNSNNDQFSTYEDIYGPTSLFTDYANEDYSLKTTGALTDTGVGGPDPITLMERCATEDFNGATRTGTCDIGAFQADGTPVSACGAGNDCYVDCSCATPGTGTTGDCDGGADDALGSLTDLNTIDFDAGDSIFFRTGTTCYGQWTIDDSGAPGSPITITDYSTAADVSAGHECGVPSLLLESPGAADDRDDCPVITGAKNSAAAEENWCWATSSHDPGGGDNLYYLAATNCAGGQSDPGIIRRQGDLDIDSQACRICEDSLGTPSVQCYVDGDCPVDETCEYSTSCASKQSVASWRLFEDDLPASSNGAAAFTEIPSTFYCYGDAYPDPTSCPGTCSITTTDPCTVDADCSQTPDAQTCSASASCQVCLTDKHCTDGNNGTTEWCGVIAPEGLASGQWTFGAAAADTGVDGWTDDGTIYYRGPADPGDVLVPQAERNLYQIIQNANASYWNISDVVLEMSYYIGMDWLGGSDIHVDQITARYHGALGTNIVSRNERFFDMRSSTTRSMAYENTADGFQYKGRFQSNNNTLMGSGLYMYNNTTWDNGGDGISIFYWDGQLDADETSTWNGRPMDGVDGRDIIEYNLSYNNGDLAGYAIDPSVAGGSGLNIDGTGCRDQDQIDACSDTTTIPCTCEEGTLCPAECPAGETCEDDQFATLKNECGGRGIELRENILHNNALAGLMLEYGPSRLWIHHNRIYDNANTDNGSFTEQINLRKAAGSYGGNVLAWNLIREGSFNDSNGGCIGMRNFAEEDGSGSGTENNWIVHNTCLLNPVAAFDEFVQFDGSFQRDDPNIVFEGAGGLFDDELCANGACDWTTNAFDNFVVNNIVDRNHRYCPGGGNCVDAGGTCGTNNDCCDGGDRENLPCDPANPPPGVNNVHMYEFFHMAPTSGEYDWNVWPYNAQSVRLPLCSAGGSACYYSNLKVCTDNGDSCTQNSQCGNNDCQLIGGVDDCPGGACAADAGGCTGGDLCCDAGARAGRSCGCASGNCQNGLFEQLADFQTINPGVEANSAILTADAITLADEVNWDWTPTVASEISRDCTGGGACENGGDDCPEGTLCCNTASSNAGDPCDWQGDNTIDEDVQTASLAWTCPAACDGAAGNCTVPCTDGKCAGGFRDQLDCTGIDIDQYGDYEGTVIGSGTLEARTMGAFYIAPGAPPDPDALWPFSTTAGNTKFLYQTDDDWTDESSTCSTGCDLPGGGPTFVTGVPTDSPSKAAECDGGSNVPDLAHDATMDLDDNPEMTIQAVVRITSGVTSFADDSAIMSKGFNQPTWYIGVDKDRNLSCCWIDTTASGYCPGSSPTLSATKTVLESAIPDDDRWHHVACIMSPSGRYAKSVVSGNVNTQTLNAAFADGVGETFDSSQNLYVMGSGDFSDLCDDDIDIDGIHVTTIAEDPADFPTIWELNGQPDRRVIIVSSD